MTISSTSSLTCAKVSADGSPTAMPSARVDICRSRTGCPAAATRPGGRLLGLHPDDPDVRPQLPDDGGDPADQAATTGRDHHGGTSGHLLEDLQADRALPAQHVRVVERVHQTAPVRAA